MQSTNFLLNYKKITVIKNTTIAAASSLVTAASTTGESSFGEGNETSGIGEKNDGSNGKQSYESYSPWRPSICSNMSCKLPKCKSMSNIGGPTSRIKRKTNLN